MRLLVFCVSLNPHGAVGLYAILSSFIKLPFVIKPVVLSIFEWPLKTGFTVPYYIDRPH